VSSRQFSPDDRALSDPVTVVVSRTVRPGAEEAFRRWVESIDAAVAGYAGHLGSVRLKEPDGVHHFGSKASVCAGSMT